MDLTCFKTLIKEHCGLLLENEKLGTLELAIHTRMSQMGLKSSTDYFNCLLQNKDEFLQLVNLLMINETYFFREPIHLKILSEQLIPELLEKKKSRTKIRILSAGCSTGEEPYSIAITLMEKYGELTRDLFSIIALDIDREAVCIAKEGVYSLSSFRNFNNFNEELKKKYFRKIGDHRYQILESVKEKVHFQATNLLSDFYLHGIVEMDIIFYRNVAIYFESIAQKKIFQKLAEILTEGGYLFTSSTETFLHNIGILSLIEINGAFLYQKKIILQVDERRKSPPTIPEISMPSSLKSPLDPLKGIPKPEKPDNASTLSQKSTQKSVPFEKRKNSHVLFDTALFLAKNKQYQEALDTINKFLEEQTSRLEAKAEQTLMPRDTTLAKANTLKASILINLQQMDEATVTCLKTLEIDPWYLESYLLLGIIAKIQSNDEEAKKRFKEALYIQPTCWLAHFYLAEIYHSQGKLDQAYKEYGIVIKLLQKGNLLEHGLTFFPLSFSAKQIVHLCHHNRNKLQERLEENHAH
ncbi:MAG TPA: CheR family methyltransferase [Candidatus Limnocylindrales bacterium]|nr:CheR family methyltransferase [Candidatus Limnocylindrales bacterium]